MAYLDWNPAYDTGIASIDYEHRRLVDLLNEVDRQAAAGADAAEIAGTLGEFHALATAHLALEEHFLASIGHPLLPDHIRDHRRLLDAVREIMDDFHRGTTPAGGLPEQLREWLGGLMGMDANVFTMADAAALKGVGLSRG